LDQSAGQVGLAIALIAFACVVAVALIVGSQLLLGNYDLRTPFSS